MTTYAFDWSFAKPDLAEVKRLGVGALRYLSSDASKNLTPAERDALHGLGLWIGLVFENGAARCLQGTSAGQADGIQAAKQAYALGAPAGTCIYAACDTDVSSAEAWKVMDYLRGFAAGLGARYKAGVYGEVMVIDYAHAHNLAAYGWQSSAAAWSNYKDSSIACLRQEVGSPIPGTDRNVVLKADCGQWFPPSIGGRGMSAPIPTNASKGYSMVIFGSGFDYNSAAALAGTRANTLATRFASDAKAAVERGETVLVVGEPACQLLGLPTAAQPHLTTSGKYVIANGSDAVASLFLAADWLNSAAGRAAA